VGIDEVVRTCSSSWISSASHGSQMGSYFQIQVDAMSLSQNIGCEHEAETS